jgi:hypothetical protein
MAATTKMKVGWADVAFAGTRTSLLAGPLDHKGEDYAKAALRAVAERGPSARVGLIPSSTTNKWEFSPDEFARIATIDPLPVPEMLRKYEQITAEASVGNHPLVLVFCGDYVMFSADHGFGDATACLEVVALASGSDVDGYLESNDDLPLKKAVNAVVSKSPSTALKALRGQPVSPPADIPHLRTYPKADVRDIVMSFVRTEPGTFNTLRKLRKESFPEVSMSAAVSYLIRRAFADHGVELTDDLGVLVDLRRFLPEGTVTLANLPGIAEVTAPVSSTLEEYGKAYNAAVSTPAPLLRLAASLLKKRILPSGQSGTESAEYPDRARTIFSDPSMHPTMKKIRWSDRGDGCMYILINDPGVPHQIPITTMWDAQGRLNITASYYSASFDRAVIDSILDDVAAQPLRYLESAAVS